MGLLDDAIREHLELKRLRGADPGEVAREQREALDPVPRDERGASRHDLDPGEGLEVAAIDDQAQPAEAAHTPDHPAGAPELAEEAENSDDMRETAELDMRTLLDEEGTPLVQTSSTTGSMHDPPEVSADEDLLEWEFPGDAATRRATEGGDHEQVSEPPEQERLRFEQPPSGGSDLEG